MSRFLTFAAVGAVATAVHYLLLTGLVELLGASPVLGTAVGFIGGGVTNYGLNRSVVFHSDRKHTEAVTRFAAVAATGFLWNVSLMFVLVEKLEVPYLVAQILVTTLLLGWHYLGNSRWTFASSS